MPGGTKIESNMKAAHLQQESKKRIEIATGAARLMHSQKTGVSKAVNHMIYNPNIALLRQT